MSSSKEVSRFFRHSAIYAVGSAMNRVGAFLLLPLYTQHLTTGQYGALEIFYAISSVVSGVLSVGIAHATLRFYFDYPDESDRKAVVSTNLMASFAISLVGVLIVASFGNHIVQWLLKGEAPFWALPIVLATLVLELSSQVALSYLRAREKSLLFIAISFGKLVVQCVANAFFLTQLDAGITGVLSGNLLAVGLGWAVLTGYTLYHCGLRFQVDKLMPVLRYSLPFLYITIVSAVSANFDRFLINALLSLEALGVYALALKFSKLISDLIGEPFNRAYGSFRFTIMGRSDAPEVQARILRYVATALAAIGLAIIYFTIDVLHVMSAPNFWAAADLMPLLVLAACLQMLNYLLQTGILYNKSTQQLVYVTIARSIAGVFVGLPLIYFGGLQGACAAAVVDAVLTVVMTHRISQRYFFVRYEFRELATLAGLSALFYALSLPLGHLAPWTAFAAKVVLWGVFVAAVLLAGVLKPDETGWLRQKLSRLRRAPGV